MKGSYESRLAFVLTLATSLAACAAHGDGGPRATAPRETAAAAHAVPGARADGAGEGARPAEPARVPRPSGPLSVAEARRYMLALVNRDRARSGLAPVALDEGAPTAAAQRHAEDMARLGYLGHWGSDGSVPEQRHTEAGGADMVLENALGFTDHKKRTLDPRPSIDPAQVERAESQFFDEVPPNDGHQRNILAPQHTHIGIGVAQPIATATELAVPCFVQELTDHYGTYGALPARAKVGASVHVEAELAEGAHPTGVGVARVALPKPIAVAELDKRRSYPVPKPFQMYWGKGFVTPVPVRIDGQKLAIDVPLSEHGRPGLYEVSVWAKLGDSKEQTIVGLRTIRVE